MAQHSEAVLTSQLIMRGYELAWLRDTAENSRLKLLWQHIRWSSSSSLGCESGTGLSSGCGGGPDSQDRLQGALASTQRGSVPAEWSR